MMAQTHPFNSDYCFLSNVLVNSLLWRGAGLTMFRGTCFTGGEGCLISKVKTELFKSRL